MPDDALSDPQSAVQEIISINVEIAQFGHRWSKAAGQIKKLTGWKKEAEAFERRHLRASKGDMWKKARAGEEELTTADRDAEIRFLVSEKYSTLYEDLDKAEQEAEECAVLFKALDRRASNAQSILAGMRDELGIKDFIYHDTPEAFGE